MSRKHSGPDRLVRVLVGFAFAAVGTGSLSYAAELNSAQPPQLMSQLTPAQRTSLPDVTLVTLKSGRVASLGVLRSEHRARMRRFAAASSALALRTVGGVGVGAPLAPSNLVPMKPVKGGPVDYVSYCKSVQASACLYLPPSPYLEYDSPSDSYIDMDSDVTHGTCGSEGGKWDGADCLFYYPAAYYGNFSPGTPPPGKPIGYGVKSSKHCSTGTFDLSVDPKGSISLIAVGKVQSFNGQAVFYLVTGSSAWLCYADVDLP